MKLFFIILSVATSTFFLLSCESENKKAKSISLENQHIPGTNQALSIDIKGIIASIEATNRIESSHIGFAGVPSSQGDLYNQLKKIATEDELITLTNYKNPVVRCYAFQALASKRSNSVFPVLLKHLNDTARIETQSGCIGSSELVGDYFLNVVTPDYIELDVYKLNEKEKKVVDSILTNDKSIVLYSKSTVLQSLEPTKENYARIRELVSKERNTSALISLAKYQKSNDKQLISTFFSEDETQYSALYAVREFPDEYFYPYITKVFEQEWKQTQYDYPKWRICYQALAKYPIPETLKLFERTVQSKDEFRYNTLCANLLTAITKYPNKIFDPLKPRINLNENYMYEVRQQLDYEDEQ